jgi:CheY-like chemotaxis protein
MNPLYNWAGKSILVVEDDDNSFFYLSEILKRTQVEIMRCKSGLSGFFQSIGYPGPDLVIMDIKLPEMSGYDSARLIKKYLPMLPIIALTACAMQDERQKCLMCGCDAYMSKPALPNDILPLLNNHLLGVRSAVVQDYSMR